MITSLDSRVFDANSEAIGVSAATLMGNAGRSIAEVIDSRYAGKRIAFACGKGNNGGDGFAAASRIIAADASVLLIEPASKITGKTSLQYFDELHCTVSDFFSEDLETYDLIVDCALGTGSAGELREPYASYADRLNGFTGDIVSVDVPTGMGTGNPVKPKLTIALHDVKEGMNETNSGEIVIKDIGIPAEAIEKVGPGDLLRYPVPRRDSHKGCGGTLLVIGGGPYFGAPALSAMAAMRTGVDLVRIATPSASYLPIAMTSPVLTVEELEGDVLGPDHVRGLLELSRAYDAVLIGPGLGTDDRTADAIRDLVGSCDKPMVIDADGLNALGKDFRANGTVILTPHSREFARLGGIIGDDSRDGVRELAERTGATVVLKGTVDIISDGGSVRYNSTGNPGMTTGGTGDVLAGIIAGLVSKQMQAFDAACLGTYISGKAGDRAFEDRSYGLIATDVVERIPSVLKDIQR